MSWMIPAATALFNLGTSYFGNKARQKEADKAYERQKELNKQGRELGMKTWDETNYPEQIKKMKEAGLNPGLIYGTGGGAGGTVTSGSGGSAQQAGIENLSTGDVTGMGLMNAQKKNIEAQTELAKANAKKAEVEANKTAGVDTKQSEEQTRGIKLVNDLNEAVQGARWNKEQAEADMQQILSERMNAEWETYKNVAYSGREYTDANALASKMVKAGLLKTIEELNNIKAQTNNTNSQTQLNKVRKTIEEYKADLAEQGINPETNGMLKFLMDAQKWFDKQPENPNL